MNQQQLQHFYSMVSFSGLLSVYAMKLSYDNRMGFDKDDFCENLTLLPEPYFHGFIVACSALGIIDYNTTKNVIFTTTHIDPLLNSTILEEIKKTLTGRDEKNWNEEFKLVEKYFE